VDPDTATFATACWISTVFTAVVALGMPIGALTVGVRR
jgi:hypothetical protein